MQGFKESGEAPGEWFFDLVTLYLIDIYFIRGMNHFFVVVVVVVFNVLSH